MNTTVTLEFTGLQIVEALRKCGHDIPDVAATTFHVPGGGNYSHMDVSITSENPLRVTFERSAAPVLEVRKLPTTEALTHGGRKTYRRFKILVNGVEMETMEENSERLGWSEGQRFMDRVESTVERYEAALRTEATRTEGRT